jgi:hypothetical protein
MICAGRGSTSRGFRARLRRMIENRKLVAELQHFTQQRSRSPALPRRPLAV